MRSHPGVIVYRGEHVLAENLRWRALGLEPSFTHGKHAVEAVVEHLQVVRHDERRETACLPKPPERR